LECAATESTGHQQHGVSGARAVCISSETLGGFQKGEKIPKISAEIKLMHGVLQVLASHV